MLVERARDVQFKTNLFFFASRCQGAEKYWLLRFRRPIWHLDPDPTQTPLALLFAMVHICSFFFFYPIAPKLQYNCPLNNSQISNKLHQEIQLYGPQKKVPVATSPFLLSVGGGNSMLFPEQRIANDT